MKQPPVIDLYLKESASVTGMDTEDYNAWWQFVYVLSSLKIIRY